MRFAIHKLLIHTTRLLICVLLTTCITPSLSTAEQKKPLAADLVVDGQAIDLGHEKYSRLFTELRDEHQFNQTELDSLFQGVTIHRRVLELMDKQWEAKPYYQYWPLFITPNVIREGKEKLKTHRAILDRVEQKLGVDREVVIAIWAIESRFGRHKGSYNVFRTLNTLFDAYPRRSKFFRGQLIHFLLLCRENNIDPLTITGSYAGAFGQTQFIPSSFREYAVSFDGDDQRDVFNSVEDILASIANYLRRFHWVLNDPTYIELGDTLKDKALISAHLKGRKGLLTWQEVSRGQNIPLPEPANGRKLSIVGLEREEKFGGGYRYVAGYPNFQAITKWNNSNRYAMAVSELSEALQRD
ncbi:MAG: lytic murein transglycosylase [Desulfobulbaceae bacterium]|uniref:Lytic murein transglycosylase n=1 Tax=Candidatus Desulfatifera sulfidica TaxID=2841691 RepID=A0A8J6TDH4_9BACT|nr:lytic murein transglycosylase [Candidatus Desulfatifera sulfidica]